MGKSMTTVRERAENSIAKGPGCWQWIGNISPTTGYGMLNIKREDGRWIPSAAHRVVYELYVGPIPAGLHLDHLCRNRVCVRPDHLEPVTPRTNFLRSHHPSAMARRTGVCKRGHQLTRGVECRQCSIERSAERRGGARPIPPLAERIARKTKPGPGGCLLWTGNLANGYPAIKVDGKSCLTHRVVLERARGPLPASVQVRRSCGNRTCVELDHLVMVPNRRR